MTYFILSSSMTIQRFHSTIHYIYLWINNYWASNISEFLLIFSEYLVQESTVKDYYILLLLNHHHHHYHYYHYYYHFH